MIRKLSFALTFFFVGFASVGGISAQASMVQSGDMTLTLPDSITITGSDIGSATNPRNCTIKASLDAKAGTTIPLRAGVVVNLVDSTGYGIDSGYSIADVEGLTHLDIPMVFHCGNGHGEATLKGPYRFTLIWRGMVATFTPDVPVNVTFVTATPTPTPTPTPTTVSTSVGTSTATSLQDALAVANERLQEMTLKNGDQAAKILDLTTQLATLTSQLSDHLIAKDAVQKQALQLKTLTLCYAKAKAIAISKKGSLTKQCLNL
jgi:hypothetical protein